MRSPTAPILTDADSYRTHPGAGPDLPARLLAAMHFPYLLWPRTLGIVFRASRKASTGRYPNEEWVKSSLATLKGLERAGVVFDIGGMDHIRAPEGPAVFVGNHMSTLETWVLPCLIQPWKDVTFVVKESLATYPIFGPVMRSRDPILVGRTNPREDYAAVIEGGAKRLGEGRSVIIFPQTTRSARFDPAQFNSMAVKLARRAGVPVVPVALKTDVWENGRRFKDFGRLVRSRPAHVRFGEPMAVTGNGAEQHARVVAFIAAALAEWGADPPVPAS